MKPDLKILALTLLLAGSVLLTPLASAQDEPLYTKPNSNRVEQEREDMDIPLLDEYVFTKAVSEKDDGYVRPTVPNLSKLYWAIGKMDLNNNVHIDNFLRINECDLYLRFYHNDFEWEQIRDATREHIQSSLAEFPTTFEITNAISVGRYNEDTQAFEILPDSQISGLRRLDFTMNRVVDKGNCGNPGFIEGYPANMVIIMNRPLTLDSIPVKPQLAKLYIEESKRQFESLPPKYQIKIYERLAYLRLKIRVLQYKETSSSISGDLRAVVFGRLEGYEIYADSNLLKPLHFKVFDDRSTRRRVLKRIKKIPEKAGEESVYGGENYEESESGNPLAD